MKRLEPKGNWKYRWEVPSSSSPNTTYVVAMSEHGDWACGCIGWTRHFPRRDCRHISRVKQVEPVDTTVRESLRVAPPPRAKIEPKRLSMKQIADLEQSLPKRFSKPSPQKPEPFFVRQTRRAITLED
jgi:hypothetical protein